MFKIIFKIIKKTRLIIKIFFKTYLVVALLIIGTVGYHLYKYPSERKVFFGQTVKDYFFVQDFIEQKWNKQLASDCHKNQWATGYQCFAHKAEEEFSTRTLSVVGVFLVWSSGLRKIIFSDLSKVEKSRVSIVDDISLTSKTKQVWHWMGVIFSAGKKSFKTSSTVVERAFKSIYAEIVGDEYEVLDQVSTPIESAIFSGDKDSGRISGSYGNGKPSEEDSNLGVNTEGMLDQMNQLKEAMKSLSPEKIEALKKQINKQNEQLMEMQEEL